MTNKKLRTSIIALSLVAVVGIGGTLAYLSANTGSKENTFTMGTGITGTTDEPNWDPENGKNYIPGKVIAKDPLITNTSVEGTDPAYVAATITYQVKDADGNWVDTTYAELDKFINIKSGNPLVDGFNTADWTMADSNTVAYYTKETVAPGAKTSTIFDAVEIDKLALTPDQVTSAAGSNIQFDTTKYNTTDAEGNVIGSYTTYEMKDFQIVIEGYMVQKSGFASSQDAMQTAFPSVFKPAV